MGWSLASQRSPMAAAQWALIWKNAGAANMATTGNPASRVDNDILSKGS